MSTARATRDPLAGVPRTLFIGGAWRAAAQGGELEVHDPATGERLLAIADAGPEDAVAALAAAAEAQESWAATPPRERSEVLRRWFDALTGHGEELAWLISREMGKPLSEARGEVAYGAEFVRWYAEEAVRLPGRYAAFPAGGSRMVSMPQPVGPCLLITPWNFPLAMATRKIAPALAAGCTCVLKPAALTPLTSLRAVQLAEEAGVPPGVVNVLSTSRSDAVTRAMIADGRARKLSFTGSTAVGSQLLELCAPRVMRTSMELGGNAAFLVFDDADLDRAVDGALLAKLRNGGESCIAANRFYVQAGIADAFAASLSGRMAALRVGPGIEDPDLGPMIDERAVVSLSALVEDAVARGARVLTGGAPPERPGSFFPPTVLRDVPPAARVLHEESFGPVAPIVVFNDEQAAVRAANATDLGLAGYVYTSDLDRAWRVADQLDVGMVGVNQGVVSNPAAPFGGVKLSGLGREGGPEGIHEYLEHKYVAFASPSAPVLQGGGA